MRKFFLLAAALCCAVMTSATEGALPGKFSVAADKQVYFSQGNLRATTDDGSHWAWSFAENQWDFVGKNVANTAISGDYRVSANGSVDLFGWSGKIYYGICNTTKDADYSGDFQDWGENRISNGGYEANLWRTLTKDEWVYLFQTREDASSKYGAAIVMHKPGIVLLPDVWTLPSDCGFTPGMLSSNDWNSVPSTNDYNSATWPAMEAAGAVFLPVAGYREGTSVWAHDQGGFYWSSTPYGQTFAHGISFYWTTLNASQGETFPRHMGFSVRLVIDVDPAEGIEEVPSSLQGRSGEASKVIRDGVLLIERGGKTYNAQGAEIH